MRAGLLSDARVVAILRELFVPVHVSALNTPHCLRDPRDAGVLRASIRADTDDFDGGEREAFVLPDGTMLPVFMSLDGPPHERRERATHYTAAGRRDEAAVATFRHRGAEALRRVHGTVPARWQELWADAGDDAVCSVRDAAPQWPEPAPGSAGLRVFVRNSYRMYDDIAGSEIAAVDPGEPVRALRAGGDEAALPREEFVRLARAMVPRGMVDTELAAESITGELRLVVERRDTARIEGRVEGTFALAPTRKREVAKRENAACLFTSKGTLRGRFAIDARTGRILALRAVATGVDFAWLPGHALGGDDFAPWHRVAVEWVDSAL